MNYNVALIGCGRIARKHLEAIKINELNLVAVCDSNITKAEQFIKEYALIETLIFQSLESLLNSHLTIDIIVVATPHASHYELSKKAILSGKHLIVEKPITINIDQAKELSKLAYKYRVKATVCHQNRFNKAVQFTLNELAEGRIGKINYISAVVRWNRNTHYYNESSWRGSRRHLDGVLMNQAIHAIDLVIMFADSEIKSLQSKLSNFMKPYIEMEDFAQIIIEFKNGIIGIIEASTSIYPENLEESIHIFTNKASVKIGGKSVNTIEKWIVENSSSDSDYFTEKYSEYPNDVYGYGHSALYEDFIQAISNDRDPRVTLESGIRAIEVVIRAYDTY